MRFPFRNLKVDSTAAVVDTVEVAISEHEVLPVIIEPPANIEEELPVEIVTYDEEAIAAIKTQAFAEGRSSALEELQNTFNLQAQEQAQALRQIAITLTELAKDTRAIQVTMAQECSELACSIANKLVGSISTDLIAQNVIEFVRDIINKATPPAPVVLLVNDAIYEMVRGACAQLIEQKEVEVLSDRNISTSDCRIEWEGGAVTRSQEQIMEKILRLMAPNCNDSK